MNIHVSTCAAAEVVQTFLSIVGLFIAVPALLYGMTFAIDYAFKILRQDSSVTAAAKEDTKASIEIAGWVIPRFYKTTSGLFQEFSNSKLQVKIGTTSRKGDIVTIPVTITNDTPSVLKATLSMNSSGSARRFKSYELTTSGILVVPGKSEERSIRVVAPEASADRVDRVVFIEVFIQNTEGESLSLKTQYEAK